MDEADDYAWEEAVADYRAALLEAQAGLEAAIEGRSSTAMLEACVCACDDKPGRCSVCKALDAVNEALWKHRQPAAHQTEGR